MALHMNTHYIKSFLAFILLVVSYLAEGQSLRVSGAAEKYRFFQIPGRVKLDKGDPTGTVVNLINLDSKQTEKSVVVNSSGKFDLSLNYFKDYKLVISKSGYYDKELEISTVIPRNVWEKDSIFPPFYIVVTLYKRVEGAILSFEGKSIGKVSYSPNGTLDNFDSNVLIDDQAIQDEINEALRNKDDKLFDQKVAEALEYEKNDDFTNAYNLYGEALKLKPSDKFVKEKLKELAADLKNRAGEAKILVAFNKLIALGDENVVNLRYSDAIQYFKDALKLMPNDPVALARLDNAGKLLASAGEQSRKEAEFNRLISAGDASVKQSNYAEAITDYKSSLLIKPGDGMALGRISDAEKLLAQATEKTKQEAEFDRLIIAGDADIALMKYTDALLDFKSALTIKPGDPLATARITDVEKLLASAADKARKESEFNRLMAEGDASVQQTKYPEAITSFKSALTIKPGDPLATARITDVEKLLASAADKARKESEFNRLMAEGDASVQQTKYPEAITSFKSALTIKPGDPLATARITDVEKLLAAAADKARRESEFNRLILEGDGKVLTKEYTEALLSYKNALALISTPDVLKKISSTELLLRQEQSELLRIAAEKQANALKKEKYEEAIRKADELFGSNNYAAAKTYYGQALEVDRTADYPAAKIKEIQVLLDEAAAKTLIDDKVAADEKSNKIEKQFAEKISTAEENFRKAQWSVARFYFIEALKIKQTDTYSLAQVEACDKMIDAGITAGKMQEYTNRISRGDEEMKIKNYSNARFYYREAANILQWEDYPKQQLKEIDKIVAESLNASDQRLFRDNMTRAEEAFNRKEYPTARFYYNKVIEVSPNDQVSSRLKEIESIMNGSESKKLETSYNDFVRKGEEALKQNNGAIARYYFLKANSLKPDEEVPRQALQKIASGSLNP